MADEAFPVLVSFEVWSPPPPSDFRIIVTGSIPQLGSWFTEKPVSMTLQGEGVWKLQLTLSSIDQFEYKYACYSNKEGRCVGYEQGPNRQMLIPLKLKQDAMQMDDSTGLRKIGVKDVWSTVPPQQAAQNAFAQRMPGPAPYRPAVPTNPMMPQIYGQAPLYGYPQPGYFPQQMPQYAMQQRSLSGYQQPVISVPGAQVAAENAANYIQQQMMRQPAPQSVAVQSPAAGPAPVDNQLNARLTKVVGEVSGLKKKLKESQREQREAVRASKEMEEKYEAQVRDLNIKIKHLEEDLELTKQAKEEIQAKALAQGKSAAAAEAADSISRQLKQSQERAAQIESTLRAETDGLRQQLDAARSENFHMKEQISKLEGEVHDARHAEAEAKHFETELGMVESCVMSYGAAVKDEHVRMSVLHPEAPVSTRIPTLLAFYEEESRRMDPSRFARLLKATKDMRIDFQKQKKKIQEGVRNEITSSLEIMRVRMKEFLADQEKEKQVYIERYHKQFNERKKLANEIVDLKGKIRVFGRARPFNQREREAGHANVLAFPEANRLLIGMDAEKFMMVNDVAEGVTTEVGQNKIDDVKTYELDHIFPPTTTQEEVFEEIRHLVGSVMDGYNVTVFAYGQTGSGKTHTMDGTAENPGITYRSLGIFFDSTDSRAGGGARAMKRTKSILKQKVEVEISMLEIYNEEIRDLLDESDLAKRAKLEVRQSADGGSFVAGLTKVPATSLQNALDIMDRGRESRKTSATKMNATSSRSHMVFTAHVSVTNPVTKDMTVSKLHLVDLAGSERVSKTGASGDQLKEAMAINKSLSALGDVISALTSSSDKAHVPYRNSKLTFLLQDSLCGNSRTAMFVNMSPSSDNFWETISTLNFGARAASVELGQVQKNFESGEIGQLRDQLTKLQAQLASTKGAVGGTVEELAAARNRVTELERESDNKERKIKVLQSKADDLTKQVEQTDANFEKKVEKMRADLKAKDEAIKQMEELLKKSKKEVATNQKGQTTELDSLQKELAGTKKQLVEMQKSYKMLETKLQQAETRAKKIDVQKSFREEGASVRGGIERIPTNTNDTSSRSVDTTTTNGGYSPSGRQAVPPRQARNLKLNPSVASRSGRVSPRAASPNSPRDLLNGGTSQSTARRTIASRKAGSVAPAVNEQGQGNMQAPPPGDEEGRLNNTPPIKNGDGQANGQDTIERSMVLEASSLTSDIDDRASNPNSLDNQQTNAMDDDIFNDTNENGDLNDNNDNDLLESVRSADDDDDV
eukprot:c10613_g1_i1.p1 GENE.c10613_g1_i1~~c10613_g1_i1.p1  ORF type:complete len:1262 (-),score=253.11 c10613_g1_i1:1331-5116(-)